MMNYGNSLSDLYVELKNFADNVEDLKFSALSSGIGLGDIRTHPILTTERVNIKKSQTIRPPSTYVDVDVEAGNIFSSGGRQELNHVSAGSETVFAPPLEDQGVVVSSGGNLLQGDQASTNITIDPGNMSAAGSAEQYNLAHSSDQFFHRETGAGVYFAPKPGGVFKNNDTKVRDWSYRLQQHSLGFTGCFSKQIRKTGLRSVRVSPKTIARKLLGLVIAHSFDLLLSASVVFVALVLASTLFGSEAGQSSYMVAFSWLTAIGPAYVGAFVYFTFFIYAVIFRVLVGTTIGFKLIGNLMLVKR